MTILGMERVQCIWNGTCVLYLEWNKYTRSGIEYVLYLERTVHTVSGMECELYLEWKLIELPG